MSPLPKPNNDSILRVPKHGEGVHNYLFRAAKGLHRWKSAKDIYEILKTATLDVGRNVPDREIKQAIENSKPYVWQPGTKSGFQNSKLTWPSPSKEQFKAAIKDGPELIDIWEMSPCRFEDDLPHTEEIIEILFPNNPLLCVGKSTYEFATRCRNTWGGRLSKMPLIVPSPMASKYGRTQEGKRSAHTLQNTGPRQFLVIEFDQADRNQQAAILWYLQKKYLPLALVVFSGSKSLHGWFPCKDIPETKLNLFMRVAVGLGADPATWTKSQFVRMPDGERENGQRQIIFYFNPEVIR